MSYYTLPMEEVISALEEKVRLFEIACKNHAEKKAAFEARKDQQDPYFSTLKVLFPGSNVEKETQANCSASWKDFLKKLDESRLEYYLAQSELKVAETKIEAMRTIISIRKEEINKFKG